MNNKPNKKPKNTSKNRNKLKQILKGVDVQLGDLPKMTKIANKMKRSQVFQRRKRAKNLIKSQNREKRKREEKLLGDKAPPKKVPKTIDDMKIPNETLVEKDDVEVEEDEKNDEFGEYFEGKAPKILMTSSRRPSPELNKNILSLTKVFPRCKYVKRRNYYIKEICDFASQRSFTDVMVWREDDKQELYELVLVHLPNGPTATFRVTHFLHPEKIEKRGKPTKHRPEVILNGFTSRLGHSIGRMFASLFPQNPQFHGRSVVTFHNQRDYIFFRFHRYDFDSVDECRIQELGPSFTLKLRSLQKGTFDTKFGEYEYLWKTEQTVDRKKFYL